MLRSLVYPYCIPCLGVLYTYIFSPSGRAGVRDLFLHQASCIPISFRPQGVRAYATYSCIKPLVYLYLFALRACGRTRNSLHQASCIVLSSRPQGVRAYAKISASSLLYSLIFSPSGRNRSLPPPKRSLKLRTQDKK